MRYIFGECECDTERYELRRAGQVVALVPMVVRVLAYFVQHPGQAVAKSALLQEFWPGAAEESYKEYSLRNCLTKIRRAVGDAGTPRAVIETVQRYGYRFTAEVTVLPTASRLAEARGPGKTDDTVSPGAEPAAPPDAVVQCPQCQTPTLARDHGVRLAVRVGIHTGLVVGGRWAAATGPSAWRWARRPTWPPGSRGRPPPTPWLLAPPRISSSRACSPARRLTLPRSKDWTSRWRRTRYSAPAGCRAA